MIANIGQFFILALGIIFAENILFSRGFGSDVVLRTAVNPKEFLKFGTIITIVTVLASIIGWAVESVADLLNYDLNSGYTFSRAVLYITGLTIIYLAANGAIKKWNKPLYEKLSLTLPIAVFNTATLGAPVMMTRINDTIMAQATDNGFLIAIFTGLFISIGFLFAVVLMSEGIQQIEAMDIPDAFKGIPAKLVYTGLLAMAFSAFSGRVASI